jgi:hypothetical protein
MLVVDECLGTRPATAMRASQIARAFRRLDAAPLLKGHMAVERPEWPPDLAATTPGFSSTLS